MKQAKVKKPPQKTQKASKKFLFAQNSELFSFTNEQLNSASPDLIFQLIVGTYYSLHRQLQVDALTKKTKILDGQPIVDYLQSTIEKVEELYPGILSEIRKQNSNFIFQC